MDRGIDVNLRSAPQMHEYDAIVEAHLPGDPRTLPYADRDPDASLGEPGRVLKPGGRLYVHKLPNSGSRRATNVEAIATRRS